MKVSGIYCISVKRRSGEVSFYIGQASDLGGRQKHHLSRLRCGTHSNPILQALFCKHGESAFDSSVLLICEARKDILAMYEQAILDFYTRVVGEDNVCNIHRICVTSRMGVISSKETRDRQSAALTGKRRSPQTIERLRQASLGKKLSPEAIAKRSAKQKGRIVSQETRLRQANAASLRTLSVETRAKISQSKRGWKPSQEHLDHLRRLAANNVGRQRPHHVIAAMAASKVGKKKSPEEIARRQSTRVANRAARLSI